ncbi:MAG TPA: ASPIC/UnbV domain-containing protein, partial [Pyrinomonadaceae bacterium]|nr:ASPIC/UnbV domain-containing protein [Pyrinomonadaceae bacterium]
WGPASYYHNEHPVAGSSLSLNLLLSVPPAHSSETIVYQGKQRSEIPVRAAVGGEVTVTRPDGKVLTRQVDGGNGHSGKRSPELHFGLGDSQGVVNVKIRWRDQRGQVHEEFLHLKPGRYTVLLAGAKLGGSS